MMVVGTIDASRTYPASAVMQQVGILLAFVVTTIGFATTTNSSRVVIELFRLGCLGLLVFSALFVVFRESGVSARPIRVIMVAACMLAYGLLLATINGGLSVVQPTLLRDSILLLLFAYLVARGGRCVVSRRVAKACVGYGVLVTALTLAADGLVLSYPPRFVFEYTALMLDRSAAYSQGISKFYGFVAIPSAYIAVTAPRLAEKAIYGAAAFLFLLLSALGGARGDSVAAVFIVAVCVLFCGSKESRIVVAGLLVVLIVAIISTVDLSDFVIFSRFAALDGGLGAREALYADALRLIGVEASCAYLGCGFGFFQNYYGYSAGSYPHNFLLEMAIVFGVPLTLLILLFAGVGLWCDLRSKGAENGVFALIVGFAFLVQMKSGTLLSAWWLMAGVFFYLVRAIDAFKIGGDYANASSNLR